MAAEHPFFRPFRPRKPRENKDKKSWSPNRTADENGRPVGEKAPGVNTDGNPAAHRHHSAESTRYVAPTSTKRMPRKT